MKFELASISNINKAIVFIKKASAEQLKEIISQAEAVRVYSIQSKKGLELQNQASEIKLRAERQLGFWLKTQPKNKGGQPVTTVLPVLSTLKELGLDKMKSSRLQSIATFPQNEFEQYIAETKAKNKEITTTEVLKRVKEKERDSMPAIKPIPLPEGQFNVVLADPPWRYEFSNTNNRKIENQYPTMEIEEIKKLEIPSAKDSVLFLWATAPKLIEALEVMLSWGFIYKTCAVWDKKIIGMGYWFRNQHELLLVGTKGNVSPPNEKNRVSSIIEMKRTGHSEKPDIIFEMIETMIPNGQYLECFARKNKKRKNWSYWGNEI